MENIASIIQLLLLVAVLIKLHCLKGKLMTIESETARVEGLTTAFNTVITKLDTIKAIIEKLVSGQISDAQLAALNTAVSTASTVAETALAKADALDGEEAPPVESRKR